MNTGEPKLSPGGCDSGLAYRLSRCHNVRSCRRGRHSSTSTATICAPEAVAHRSLPWSGCSRRSASRHPAVRTAVSRMVRQGLVAPPATGLRTGLSADRKSGPAFGRGGGPDLPHRPRRLGRDGSISSCYTTRSPASATPARLAFLGYGSARRPRAWVAPRAGRRDRRGADARPRSATSGSAPATRPVRRARPKIVGRAWNLDELGRSYEGFIADLRPVVTAVTARSTDEEAYAARFQLVHAWRSLPVPRPATAHRAAAATLARGERGRLLRQATRSGCGPAADRYVERCLQSVTRGGRVGLSDYMTDSLLVDRTEARSSRSRSTGPRR